MFLQITKRIRRDIISGKYPIDSQIPSVRQIAEMATVNPNTVQRALLRLEDEKLVYSRQTLGRFVTSDSEAIRIAGENELKELMRRFVCEAAELGVSIDGLIDFLVKEKENE